MHKNTLFFLITCAVLSSSSAMAAPARTLADLAWPAPQYRADQAKTEENSYCALILEQEYKIPSVVDHLVIDGIMTAANLQLEAFRTHFLGGGKGIPDDLEAKLHATNIALIELRNEFGFELGVKKGFVQQSEGISVLLLLNGFIPTKGELEAFANEMAARIEKAKSSGEEPSEELLESVRWDVSLLQKLDGTYKIAYGKDLDVSDAVVQAFIALIK
jgi:hypothetical protein